MNQHRPEPMAALDALSRAARAEADRQSGGAPPMDGWQRLERSLSAAPSGGRARRLVLAGIGAAALALGAYRLARPARIAYTVEGATAEAGYVHAVPAAGARMHFSDGSEVALAAGSRCLVVGTDRNGARLRVEDGRARVRVAHRTGTHWSVEAGPFEVTVTGTEFDVGWSGAGESFRLRMHAGSVNVRGPVAGGAVTLRGGQELSVDLRRKTLSITEPGSSERATVAAPAATHPAASTPPAAGTPAAALPEAPSVAAAPEAPAPASRATRAQRRIAMVAPAVGAAPAPQPAATPALPPAPAPDESAAAVAVAFAPQEWSKLVATGHARDVIDEAVAHDLATCLRELSSAQLSALADAARYGGKTSLARDVLQAQRRRFPASEASTRAAFLLGRMADDNGVSPAEALRWYNLYLDEAHDGPYAAEALGRKMLAVEKLEGREAARYWARLYLRRFPNGPYMLQARHIADDQ